MSKSRWILANALAGALALAVTGLGGALSSRISPDGSSEAALLVAMILTGAVEGAIVGALQAWALDAPRGPWVAATSAGVAGAWGLGIAGSFLEPTAAPSLAAVFAAALLFGAVLGTVVGLLQRRVVPIEGWARVNAMGWAGALVVGAIAADLVPHGRFTLLTLAISVGGGVASGALLGAITAGHAVAAGPFPNRDHPDAQ